MNKLIFIFCLTGFIIACSKDSVDTKPSLKIESVSSDIIAKNQDLNVTMSFTDKEGDVNDTLFIIRTRTNKRGPVTLKPLALKVPDFPSKTKGEITANLSYSNHLTLQLSPLSIPGNASQNEPDTLILKFVLKDKEKNVSDTATANVIVQRS
jgi:hypothetical protein